MNEKGVIGVASSLVRISFEYENLAKYLLGRILVVVNIDNALLLQENTNSLRIVTLEGEQLNPGGSMTGGAFKNAGNLLGRRREIEELKVNTTNVNKQFNDTKNEIAELRKLVASNKRRTLRMLNKQMREAQLNKNTVQLNLKQALSKKSEIIDSYKDSQIQVAEIGKEIESVLQQQSLVSGNLENLNSSTESSQKEIDELTSLLESKKQEEAKHLTDSEHVKNRIFFAFAKRKLYR